MRRGAPLAAPGGATTRLPRPAEGGRWDPIKLSIFPEPGIRSQKCRAGLATETTGPNGRTAETNPGDLDQASMWARTRPVRGYEARAALGSEEKSRETVIDPGCG
ncbi:hypothetical protein NDU88_003310 [Pleurodeles waltl]|uniref:Uncharacterized protein n=1 Tax=Pleurodeles waltl TaxID=8319 RepID=A0AAV7NKC8_PLEWA|nr:hypothetical protein NDU88_003310 [Pleurodeles waltl]